MLLKVHAGPDAPDLRVDNWSALRAERLHVERAAEPVEPVELTVEATGEPC